MSYWLGRLLIRVDHIGMVNIIAGERIVPELVQKEVTADRILAETRRMLQPEVNRAVVRKLEAVRERLGPPGAPGRVADHGHVVAGPERGWESVRVVEFQGSDRGSPPHVRQMNPMWGRPRSPQGT